MRRREAWKSLGVVAGLLLVGCGGDDQSSTIPPVTFSTTTSARATTASVPPTSPPETEQTATTVAPSMAPSSSATPSWPPSQELLDQALLQISDMPTGWAAIDPGSNRRACNLDLAAVTGVEVPYSEVRYAEDENFGPLTVLAVAVLPPDLGNLDVLGTYRQASLECRQTIDGFEVSYSELSYPTLGDQSFAVRQTAKKGDTTIVVDQVLARSGNIMIQVGGADYFGDAIDIVNQFAEPQLQRAVDVLG